MAEFSEDQRIVIRALAAEEASKALTTWDELPRRVDERIAAKLPFLSKAEGIFGPWKATIVAIVIAVPLAGLGLNTVINEMIDARFKSNEEKLKIGVEDKLKPSIDAASNDFKKFRKDLASHLELSVDSATTKLLRFGCNRIDGPAPPPKATGFPPCPTTAFEDVTVSNARNVLEAYEQTIVFKRNRGQRALLWLALNPVDGLPLLRHIGLRLSVPPLLNTGNKDSRDDIRLKAADLPNTHQFIEETSGMIALVGRIKNLSDEEPLVGYFDITNHFSDESDIHALRLWSDHLADAPQGVPYRGNERFFVLATVIVTHRLSHE